MAKISMESNLSRRKSDKKTSLFNEPMFISLNLQELIQHLLF